VAPKIAPLKHATHMAAGTPKMAMLMPSRVIAMPPAVALAAAAAMLGAS
jgi:hypothetical protein